MKFHEVDKALLGGEKVKLAHWKNAYWYINKDGQLMNHDEKGEECLARTLFPEDVLWVMMGEWEIVKQDATPEEETPTEPAHDDGFCFSEALYRLKLGQRVARKGWNGKGMYLFLADSFTFHTDADLSDMRLREGELTLPAIVLKTADDQFCVGWTAWSLDMLAEDWQVV